MTLRSIEGIPIGCEEDDMGRRRFKYSCLINDDFENVGKSDKYLEMSSRFIVMTSQNSSSKGIKHTRNTNRKGCDLAKKHLNSSLDILKILIRNLALILSVDMALFRLY